MNPRTNGEPEYQAEHTSWTEPFCAALQVFPYYQYSTISRSVSVCELAERTYISYILNHQQLEQSEE